MDDNLSVVTTNLRKYKLADGELDQMVLKALLRLEKVNSSEGTDSQRLHSVLHSAPLKHSGFLEVKFIRGYGPYCYFRYRDQGV
jgi:hypothetical protein